MNGVAKMKEKKFTISLIVRDEGTVTELTLKLDNVSCSFGCKTVDVKIKQVKRQKTSQNKSL